jgi:MFS family permease
MALPPAATRAADRGASGSLDRSEAGGVALRVWRELLAGLRLMRANETVAALFLMWTITSIGEGLLDVLVVPWVSSVMGGTSFTFGWMLTVQAIGSIASGALLASAGKTRQARWLVVLGALGWGVIDLAIFNARSIPLALALFVLVGIPIAAMVVSFNALIQCEVPDAYRGRVFGVLGTAAAIAMLAGMGLSSALADRVGIVTMLNVACVTVIIGAAAAWLTLVGRPARRAQAA